MIFYDNVIADKNYRIQVEYANFGISINFRNSNLEYWQICFQRI